MVNLQCDRKRKSIQSADFSVIKDDKARPVVSQNNKLKFHDAIKPPSKYPQDICSF